MHFNSNFPKSIPTFSHGKIPPVALYDMATALSNHLMCLLEVANQLEYSTGQKIAAWCWSLWLRHTVYMYTKDIQHRTGLPEWKPNICPNRGDAFKIQDELVSLTLARIFVPYPASYDEQHSVRVLPVSDHCCKIEEIHGNLNSIDFHSESS